ncbi:reverse transcriptase domain-containing protein [Tanacetum coccineum]|uniref:Reverse transcriptase domain-containing protein n=1 Tax=Tanacetum coccineum TaxID=301880 RepID=A0ABQ5D9Z3_9ASTR
MPTWCHMFNSTLMGSARLWFDELPSESIDSFVELRKAFLAYFLQQKKYIKGPVELHHIKQREGEVNICVHGSLQSRKSAREGSFGMSREERWARPTNPKEKGTLPQKTMRTQTSPALAKSQTSSLGRRNDRFTPPPKEILAMDTVMFKPPPPMSSSAQNRNKNKYREFHGDKGK